MEFVGDSGLFFRWFRAKSGIGNYLLDLSYLLGSLLYAHVIKGNDVGFGMLITFSW